MGSIDDEARYQDVVSQFPQLKTYNHGVLIFPLSYEISPGSVVQALEAATTRITSKIPWLAQQVVHVGKEIGNSGTFKLALWPSSAARNTLVRATDCSGLCPSYDEILKAQGPAWMLDASVICPFPGFPTPYDESKIGPAPAVMVQANIIKGGLILNFSNQHNVMDATGLFQFMALLAAVMNGKEVSQTATEWGSRDRKTVIPLYGPSAGVGGP